MPGECHERDADGQACARGVVHLLHPHQATGLREWLEEGSERALIRCYDAKRAAALEAMEAPLFARFEFAPIAHQDLAQTQAGGLNELWSIWVSPMVAPREHVTIHLQLVCYARPW